jgi:hypothetical protein
VSIYPVDSCGEIDDVVSRVARLYTLLAGPC